MYINISNRYTETPTSIPNLLIIKNVIITTPAENMPTSKSMTFFSFLFAHFPIFSHNMITGGYRNTYERRKYLCIELLTIATLEVVHILPLHKQLQSIILKFLLPVIYCLVIKRAFILALS